MRPSIHSRGGGARKRARRAIRTAESLTDIRTTNAVHTPQPSLVSQESQSEYVMSVESTLDMIERARAFHGRRTTTFLMNVDTNGFLMRSTSTVRNEYHIPDADAVPSSASLARIAVASSAGGIFNREAAFRKGRMWRGILCPSVSSSFHSPTLERSYLLYSHRQRQKSLIIVNIVDMMLKIILAIVSSWRMESSHITATELAWTICGSAINLGICVLGMWRCFANNYLHWGAVLTWLLMIVQGFVGESMSTARYSNGSWYMLFVIFVPYSMLPLSLKWCITGGFITALCHLSLTYYQKFKLDNDTTSYPVSVFRWRIERLFYTTEYVPMRADGGQRVGLCGHQYGRYVYEIYDRPRTADGVSRNTQGYGE